MTKKQSCLLLFQITVHVYAKVISLIFMMTHNKNVDISMVKFYT